jgi:hypothetical protein
MKSKYVILVILSAVFVFSRLLILFACSHGLFSFIELSIGTAAKGIIEGQSALPLYDYFSESPHRGGPVIAAILTVPLFTLLGQSYFVLKLVALLFSLGILILAYLFLWKFFGRIAAVINSLIIIFAPATYTKFSLQLLGLQYELIIFTLAAVFIFYRIFFEQRSSPAGATGQIDIYSDKNVYFAAFGLVCGLGIYFGQIFSVTLVACFLFWFIFDKLFFIRKGFLIFVVFFVIGMAPWICFNLTHKFSGPMFFYSGHFFKGALIYDYHTINLSHLRDLLIFDLPNSFSPDGSDGSVVAYAFYAVFLISYGYLLWQNRMIVARLILGIIPLKKLHIAANRMQREAFLVIFPLIYILVYLFAGYSIRRWLDGYREYKRLILLYPFIFIVISLFLQRLWDFSKRSKRATAIIFFIALLFFIAAGTAGDCHLCKAFSVHNPLSSEGFAYEMVGYAIWPLYRNYPIKAMKLISDFAPHCRPSISLGVGLSIGRLFFEKRYYDDIQECCRFIDMFDARYRPYVYSGLGASIMPVYPDVIRIAAIINQVDESHRPQLYYGVGCSIGYAFKEDIHKSIGMIDQVDEKYRSECYRGLGAMVGRIFGDVPYCVRLLNNVPLAYQCSAFEGLAGHLYWRYRYFLKKDPLDLVKEIPKEHQACFSNGLYFPEQ